MEADDDEADHDQPGIWAAKLYKDLYIARPVCLVPTGCIVVSLARFNESEVEQYLTKGGIQFGARKPRRYRIHMHK